MRIFSLPSLRPAAILCCLIPCCLAPLAMAGEAEGQRAMLKGQLEQAFAAWKPLAEKGLVRAQETIAVMYHAGQGVAQDYTQAVHWYRRAAEKGDRAAQANLGVMYAKGVGVEEDPLQAWVWYDLAATGGEQRHARKRDELSSRLSAAQLAQARRLSREYAAKFVAPFASSRKPQGANKAGQG